MAVNGFWIQDPVAFFPPSRHTAPAMPLGPPAAPVLPPFPDDGAGRAAARARAHGRVAVALLAVNGGLYAALILLIAFAKPFLAQLVVPGISLAILAGTLVTVAAWLVTVLYVRWADAREHRER